ncbi:hypothetical protein ZWY2020_018443 [Hordeum vulgare]|nr:hypothetical protein ZWY2020_018443 [Hordeum vulgare]
MDFRHARPPPGTFNRKHLPWPRFHRSTLPPHPSPPSPPARRPTRPHRPAWRFPPLRRGSTSATRQRDYLLRFHTARGLLLELEEGASGDDGSAGAGGAEVPAMMEKRRGGPPHALPQGLWLLPTDQGCAPPGAVLREHQGCAAFGLPGGGVRRRRKASGGGWHAGWEGPTGGACPGGQEDQTGSKEGCFPVDGGHTDEDDEEDDNVVEGSSAVDGEFRDLF